MLPEAITLRNYRCFAAPVRLELRPVTLLYGINNAGKSALLRALPILCNSVAPEASGPLDLECPAARGSSFQDLRWKGIGEDDDPDLGVTFHWQDDTTPAELELKLTWFEEWRRVIVRRFSLGDAGGVSVLEAEWKRLREERSEMALTYEVRDRASGPVSLARVCFRGLVPEDQSTEPRKVLIGTEERLRGFRNQVQWLGAARRPPARISPYPTAPRWRISPDGSDAAAALASSPELLAEVSSWYQRHLGRRLQLLEVHGSGFRLMLENERPPELDVDLADTGEGMIQVLPVLGALALARRRIHGGPGILAIEKPESHLHGNLQRALAEQICLLAAEHSPPKIVLETHSEHLLLGVQLAVVRGRLRPEDVLVYWVRQLDDGQSVAEPVTFDRDARPQGNWPPEVFSDDTEVAREIIRERRKRNGS